MHRLQRMRYDTPASERERAAAARQLVVFSATVESARRPTVVMRLSRFCPRSCPEFTEQRGVTYLRSLWYLKSRRFASRKTICFVVRLPHLLLLRTALPSSSGHRWPVSLPLLPCTMKKTHTLPTSFSLHFHVSSVAA